MNSLLILAVISLCYMTFSYVTKKDENVVPWMGVLLYKPDDETPGEVTHVVMINQRITLAVAQYITAVKWELLKKFGKVMFENGNTPWDVGLFHHLIHPEYYKGTLNTIAIVFLDSIKKPELCIPIGLIEDAKTYSKSSEFFSIGYTDRNLVLEQMMKPMTYVGKSACKKFYVEEEIDMESLWPSNPICFRVTDAKETCVSDAGMALASNSSKKWVLVGLSTHGPGCSLPGRYIEILPYVKWIRDNTEVTKPARRSYYYLAPGTFEFNKPNEDEKFLKEIRESVHTMSTSYANKTITIEGCGRGTNTTIMYAENNFFKLKSPYVVGLYKIYITDTNFKYRTCVTMYVRCLEMSYPYYNYEYHRAVTEGTPMFGKLVPSRIRDAARNDTGMVITDPRHMDLQTYYLYFKFAFSFDAVMDYRVYGEYNGTGS